MMCYLDKTFCASKNCQNECGRKFTAEDAIAAKKWWGSDQYPVAYSHFCGEDDEVNLSS